MKNFVRSALNLVMIMAGLIAGDDMLANSGNGPEKWLIVNYWSEWCAPCREEIPMLNALNDQLALSGTDVTIVGVNFEDDPLEKTLKIAQRMGIAFPTLTRDAVNELQLTAPSVLPTTYILSPENQPVAKLVGAQDKASLLAQLEQLNLLDQREAEVTMIDNPAGSNSSLSRVATGSDGSLYLSWVTSQEETSTLSYARFEQGQWEASKVIARGEDWFVNWADFPSMSINGDTMAAHWLSMSAAGVYDYDVKASFYRAEDQAWSEPVTVNKDGVSAEHGFVSMTPLSGGRTFMSWLDGRNTRSDSVGEETATGHEEHGAAGAMTLRGAVYDRDGNPLQEWELDSRVCDCCQTSTALAASGPIVVYRDRSDTEVRDTYITRLVGDQWSFPIAVFNDGWEIAGCPVNGPSVTAQGQFVAVAWFTAVNDSPQVKLSVSHDSGATFAAPIIVSDENTLGRIGSSMLSSGELVVSWVEADEEAAHVMLARYSAAGQLLDRVQVAQTSPSRRSGFPVVTSAGNDVFVTWTDISAEPRVRLARVRFVTGSGTGH